MCDDRGYLVYKENLKMTLEEWKLKFATGEGKPTRKDLTFVVAHVDDEVRPVPYLSPPRPGPPPSLSLAPCTTNHAHAPFWSPSGHSWLQSLVSRSPTPTRVTMSTFAQYTRPGLVATCFYWHRREETVLIPEPRTPPLFPLSPLLCFLCRSLHLEPFPATYPGQEALCLLSRRPKSRDGGHQIVRYLAQSYMDHRSVAIG